MANRAEQALKSLIELGGPEGALMKEARALLGKRVRRVYERGSRALAKPLPADTPGRVIEVAMPIWLFVRQDGTPQPEYTIEFTDPILTVVWDIPGGEDEFEATLHWDEYLDEVSAA